MRHTRGMTMLEMMVAVAIIGALASLAVVNIQSGVDRQRENEATRDLAAQALRARQRAIATNQPVRFVVEDVRQPNGALRAVARWERLKCDNAWDNDACPQTACQNTTCRATPSCCDEVGPDLMLPRSMNASAMNGLCYLPGSGRAVRPGDLSCMRGKLDDAAAMASAVPGNLRVTFSSTRARSLMVVEPLTGLVSVLDCDSQAAKAHPVTECTN